MLITMNNPNKLSEQEILRTTISSGNEGELGEVLVKINSSFTFLSEQLDGKLRQLEDNGRLDAVRENSHLKRSQEIISDWNDLYEVCEQEAKEEDGNRRKHLVDDENRVPCLEWLDELRSCFRQMRTL